jgi:hypothetical protein
MPDMPPSVQRALKRLQRQLALGVFLDLWPGWAAASLLGAGMVALACRMFVPGVREALPWLWVVPFLVAVPVVIVCVTRRYRAEQIAALADSLGGGHGLLLSQFEYGDPAWWESPLLARAAAFSLPRIRPWRKLAPLLPAIFFLAASLSVPQRVPGSGDVALAKEIAADLTAKVQELKQEALVTPEEEQRLEEEIERIRRAAEERVDASAWEAADALKEKMSATLAEKQDALQWAEQSLARYNAAVAAGASAEGRAASAAELSKALEKLAQSGLLAGAPADLQRLLKGGKLPTDPASMQQLASALAKYLAETGTRVGDLAQAGRGRGGGAGKFDPSEFPLGSATRDGRGDPGRGGINRGRGDAQLTWGKESLPIDRFKARALPPGGAASPDDWAPVVEAPGAPQTSPVLSTAAAARSYESSAGQGAWRRTLAPRHRSAVRKYFDK